MMKKIWKDKWVKALRSGEYAQGEGRLCTLGNKHDYFCCLGVLCDIVDDSKWRENYVGLYYSGEELKLPKSVREKTGLKDKNCIVELINMNDDGKKFSTIANYIEENL